VFEGEENIFVSRLHSLIKSHLHSDILQCFTDLVMPIDHAHIAEAMFTSLWGWCLLFVSLCIYFMCFLKLFCAYSCQELYWIMSDEKPVVIKTSKKKVKTTSHGELCSLRCIVHYEDNVDDLMLKPLKKTDFWANTGI